MKRLKVLGYFCPITSLLSVFSYCPSDLMLLSTSISNGYCPAINLQIQLLLKSIRKFTLWNLKGKKIQDLFHYFRSVNRVQLSSGRDGAENSRGQWCPMLGEGDLQCVGGDGALPSSPGEPRSWHSVQVPVYPGAEEGAGVSQTCQAWRRHRYHSYLCAALKNSFQMLPSRCKWRRATWNLPGKRE